MGDRSLHCSCGVSYVGDRKFILLHFQSPIILPLDRKLNIILGLTKLSKNHQGEVTNLKKVQIIGLHWTYR